VFIDGCFWHACPEHGHAVRTNSDYWSPKLLRNVERDRETDAVLIAAGWTVLRFWEHLAPERVAQEIADVVAAASPPMSVRGRQ
jgi:DNA mismatch endonuclease (patch repair protein)